jgi:hypothetical protein
MEQNEIKNTLIITLPKLIQLSKLNTLNNIPYTLYQTEKIDPIKYINNFMIDGLNTKKKWVYNKFIKLTLKTYISLNINEKINIHINYYHSNNDKKLIEKCTKRIFCFLNAFGNLECSNMYDGMKIDILLYDSPRIITNSYKKTSDEMNKINDDCWFNCTCGYSTIDREKFYICVSRKKGCLGLLTHELGHICELDLGIIEQCKFINPYNRMTQWKEHVKKYFDINDKCIIGNLNEGINNGNSSIIHAMFMAIENGITKEDICKKYIKYYLEEFNYSFLMLKKLLHWFKYNSIYELVKKEKCKYIQISQMLEYIFVRCVYLLNFNELKIFKINKKINKVNDEEYFKIFNTKLYSSLKIMDDIMAKLEINNNKIIFMEYYYNL